MLKLLFKYYPKYFKKFLFPSTIVLSILSTLVYLYLADKQITISTDALIKLAIAFLIYLFSVSFLGFFIAYNRILYDVYYSSQKNISSIHSESIKPKKDKIEEQKYIPYQFELEILNRNIIEYTVFVKRSWYPDEQKPGIESFLNAIGFSEPRCGKCHTDFYKHYGSYEYLECTNRDCDNAEKFYSDDIFTITQKIETKYKGNIRTNYDKYWKKYIKVRKVMQKKPLR
ncbi:MAG: hypothetical protein IH949_12885, partial [Bacteroidetes bacterium]|nr:hypothetical protein [Bacteroidota bacterium]